MKLEDWVDLDFFKPCIIGKISLPVVLVQESFLGSLIVQQYAGDLCYSLALGCIDNSIDFQTDSLLKKTKTILFSPRCNREGADAWIKWKRSYPQSYRLLTPEEEDVYLAYNGGLNIREWVEIRINEVQK